MADKITKKDIIDSIYSKGNCERQDISYVVDAFLEEVKTALQDGKNIELRGFGIFETRLRKGKSAARNPKTGEHVAVDPHYVAAFRAGKELKEKLWELKK